MSFQYRVGDLVKVRRENLEGNPRTPKYVRGKEGVITDVHGMMEDSIDHRGMYPPLYTVEFKIQDLFGGASYDTIRVQIHEEWLEKSKGPSS